MEYQLGGSLEELATFVAVVDASGFSAASRATGARKATLTHRVQQLERRLGVILLIRTTRSLRLTDEGRAYYEQAKRALAAARDAEAVAVSAKAEPSGTLRVTTSAALAGLLLEGVVVQFLRRYRRVSLVLNTSVRRLDLVREGIDLAIRPAPLSDSSLVARRLGVLTGGYYASPRYLDKRGRPSRPEDVREHDAIVIPGDTEPMEWPFSIGGRKRMIPVRPRLSVTSFELAARAAAAGLGLLRSPSYFVRPFLAKRQLVPVLSEWTPPGGEIHAVFPPGGTLLPRARVFVDMLASWFEDNAEST
jgi:LysR family transcriptional regulator, regulator for bpeEF and oprC